MRLHGVAIDFVNLRSESYSDDSRIPTMVRGSRRFYGLNCHVKIDEARIFCHAPVKHAKVLFCRRLELQKKMRSAEI